MVKRVHAQFSAYSSEPCLRGDIETQFQVTLSKIVQQSLDDWGEFNLKPFPFQR